MEYSKASRKLVRAIMHWTIPVLVLCLMCGCRVGPNFVSPEVPVADGWIYNKDPGITSQTLSLANWWGQFNDPILDTLILKAYQGNLPFQIAGLRILQARAELGIAVGEQFPQVQRLVGDYTQTKLSKNAPNSQRGADFHFADVFLGFDVAWEMDFWGRFRRAVESSKQLLEASIADTQSVQVLLTAEVARIYVVIRTFETRLGFARSNVEIQTRSLRIVEARHAGGEITELDVQQARNLLADTQASIPRLERDLRQAKNALATLLGLMPGEADALLGAEHTIPTPPATIFAGIPAEMLRQRPDIRSAEHQAAAQCARIGVAKADLYPHFSLFGTLGFHGSNADVTAAGTDRLPGGALDPGGSNLSDMFHHDSLEYFVGPSFSWDVLNYGRIKNRVRVEDALFEQLLINYLDTVLQAAREVEDAMAGFVHGRQEAALLQTGVQAAQRAVDISLVQYQEGLTDYERALDAQRTLSLEQDRLATVDGEVVLSVVSAYRSLGGGWDVQSAQDVLPESTQQEMQERTNWGKFLKETSASKPTHADPVPVATRKE